MFNMVSIKTLQYYNKVMQSYIQQQLGARIQELRKLKGMSQEIFAEHIGIATNTLSSIETGNAFMTATTLEKIIAVLNVTPKELFSFNESNTNEDMYNYIVEKLNFIKDNPEHLKIFYKIIKSLF